MRKIYSLLVLMLTIFSANVSAADAVSATQTLSNSNKTCTWTEFSCTVAKGNSGIGANGIYFDATDGKVNNPCNPQSGCKMYVEAPAGSAGSIGITCTGNADARTVVLKNGTAIKMNTTEQTANFTSSDLVTIEGKNYIELTSTGDFKIKQIVVTLTTGVYPNIDVVTQELTGVTINGVEDAAALSALKSTKAYTATGTYNGVNVSFAVNTGTAKVTKAVEGNNYVYTAKLNNTDNYVLTIPNAVKTYSANGAVVAYKEDDQEADGANTKTVKMHDISMSMVAEKTFQYGSGNVTLGSKKYVPLKLSTGSAVNVTLPTGMVAKSITIYGWSAEGNGRIHSLAETAESESPIDMTEKIFYAKNEADETNPSVYTIDVDEWESIYYNPGGSPSQPFIVMDIKLDTASGIKTINSAASEGKMYNLAGQQVSSNAKGIIIMNGKKYMK